MRKNYTGFFLSERVSFVVWQRNFKKKIIRGRFSKKWAKRFFRCRTTKERFRFFLKNQKIKKIKYFVWGGVPDFGEVDKNYHFIPLPLMVSRSSKTRFKLSAGVRILTLGYNKNIYIYNWFGGVQLSRTITNICTSKSTNVRTNTLSWLMVDIGKTKLWSWL